MSRSTGGGGRRTRRTRRAWLGLAILVALGAGIQQLPNQLPGSPAPTAAPTAAAGTGSDALDPLAAPAQSALDQVLGPNHAVVTASAVYAQPVSRLSSTYNGKHVAVLARSTATGPGYTSSVTNNGVSQAVTSLVVPSGQIRRLSVTVIVDSSLRPAPKAATVRRVVSAALGLQPARGDRLAVLTAALPASATAGTAATAATAGTSAVATTATAVVPTTLVPYLRSVTAIVVALGLLLVLSVDLLKHRRRP